MARRRHPFFKPVSHRVADNARRDFSNWIYNKLLGIFNLFILWLFFYAGLLFLMEDPISFKEYVDGTMMIITPIFTFISELVVTLFNAVTAQ